MAKWQHYFPTCAAFMSKGFLKFSLADRVNEALVKIGYKKPTAVQDEVIPLMLSKRNVIVEAATGTGKTAAYLEIEVAVHLHFLLVYQVYLLVWEHSSFVYHQAGEVEEQVLEMLFSSNHLKWEEH